MAGPPEDKQAGQQNLSKHGQHAMDGADDKPSDPNESGYKYHHLGTDESGKSDKEIYGQAREHNRGNQHDGPQYTGATSSYYKVSIDDLRQIHKQLKGMVDAADYDRVQADHIAEAQAPATDQDGSVMHAKALRSWGSSLREQAQQHYDALLQYKDNIGDIINRYGKNEHDATITFRDFEGKL